MWLGASVVLFAACGGGDGDEPIAPPHEEEPTLLSSIPPITDPTMAKTKTYIPPFKRCQPARADAPAAGLSIGDEVCTPVSTSGCTAPGLYYPDYGTCSVVRTQRPYWPAAAAHEPNLEDPRLNDAAFMSELAWVTDQIRSTACTCCHDSRVSPAGPSQWYIDAPGVWTDTVSDSGVALFTGYADSSSLGAWDPSDNNGYQRQLTGIPSTDGDRMRAFFVAELTRRGITKEQAEATPPFGGPTFASLQKKPEPCAAGEGVDSALRVKWKAENTARYVYVLEESAKNPAPAPYRDRPEGALFRLDVLASAEALSSGFRYGTTPSGSAQAIPASGRAPALKAGTTYHLFVMRDMGAVTTNCLFTYPAE